MSGTAIDFEGVRLTSPDKVLYPEQGVTKLALAEYYRAVAPAMLPHVADRPITLVRCPAGQEKTCFYQRHAGSGVSDSLGQVVVPGFEEPYLYLRDAAGLFALVQMGVLEIHPWGARRDRPDRPDRVVFDFDPGEGVTFADVVAAALDMRARLGRLGLVGVCKTSGGKGLHLVVPIERRHDYPEVKAFAKAVSEQAAREMPERYLTRISKAERVGRILIDYLRNDPTSTAIAPYSTRARPKATVSTPLDWSEVTPGLDPACFTIETVPIRLQGLGDPWASVGDIRQRLPR
ncbi:non-homologous end-joining DNA ligase [Prosthecomicrobium sp. N25]|uniref:non-homologous end-joining DNA ligase n=1 Tax=Prosthecomicrobium sp. N25 TaxID=3129254 RepID=UPI003076ED60